MGNPRGLGLHLFFISIFFLVTTNTCLGDGNFSVVCSQKERLALLRFKDSVEDDGGMLSSWVGNDCCQWERIQCDAVTGTVESLHLRGDYNGYEGHDYLVGKEVNSSLAELRHLNYLDLSNNDFERSRIPEFIGSFKQLSYLNLSYAFFEGIIPPHIGNLSNLKVLDLNSNGGLIADDMIRTLSLPSLEHLDLSGLYLGGWDMELYMFPSLKELSLHGCGLSNLNLGSCLNSSRILSNIQLLDLGFNSFKNPLPRFFQNMTSLAFLDLSYFNFSLSWNFANFLDMIPFSLSELHLSECGLDNTLLSFPHLNFTTISNIQHLDLSYNSIEGIFPHVLTNMSYLRVLDLSYNRFKKIQHLGIWRLCHLKQLIASSNPINIEVTDSPKNVSECSQYALERLDLSYSLNGTVPESLGRLANLRSLDLSDSSLTGTIPEALGRLRYLEALDLSFNQLDGSIPESLGRLVNLRDIKLRVNRLTGTIPESLGRLRYLETLYLNDNQLNGSIPEFFGKSTALKYLYLDHNQLSGTIPVSVWQLTNLHSLIIGYNSLEGVVSEAHLSNLSMLKELDTSNTKLIFNISREWIPPFQLEILLLRSCKIRNGFPQWLRNQRELVSLDLSNATVSGPLPTWLRKMPIISDLDLSHNKLSGSLTNLPQGEKLDVYGYGRLFLENNLFNGSIPRSLCRRTDLHFLDLSRNRLTGKIPKCLGNIQNLGVMIFSSNQLSGVIPRELGTLEGLSVLDLGENKLSGYIPVPIGEGLVSLVVFRLHKNNFTGTIPRSLCKMSQLHVLDVAYNNLTGTIPDCLRELNAMVNSSQEYFYLNSNEIVIEVLKGADLEYSGTLGLVFNMDLSSNKLVGEIPLELTTLSMLVGLNLSNNHLRGVIPGNIGNLRMLESLDLSGNQLNGSIPQSMADLTFLSHLNLSHNNLAGRIPTGRQLQTLTDPSIYSGNKGLCGPPLPNNCSSHKVPTTTTTTSNKKHKAGDELAKVWLFYVDIMSGFATGFWGVIGVLLWKKQWRQKLFMFAEETMDKIYVAVMVRVARVKRGREH